jgi:hypothetical protein
VKIALALTAAAALAAGALVGVPASAAPAPSTETVQPRALKKESFTVFGKFTGRQTVTYGDAKGIGNLSIAQGTISDSAGKKVGTLTTVMRVVAPSSKSDAELRDTQSQIQLKNGQIFAQSVNEDPKGKPPQTLHIMPVTGGTGAYASARGTLLMRPVGDKYLMAYDIFVEKELKSETFAFDTIVEGGASGTGPQGIGNAALLRGSGGANSYILIATQIAGTPSAASMESVDMQVFTPTGSLFARSIVRAKGSTQRGATFAVLGGTGAYAGHRGELIYSASGKSITVRTAKPGGSAKPLTWFEDGGRSVAEVEIPGGSFLGADGYMFKTANTKAKKTGDYYATLLTYDEIDGVVPVVGMIEQEFKTGTMIITGITLAAEGTPAERPIVGGTGDYGGAAGQATSAELSPGVWRKTARFWR